MDGRKEPRRLTRARSALLLLIVLLGLGACATTPRAAAQPRPVALEITNRTVDLQGAVTLSSVREVINRIIELDTLGAQPIFIRINAHGKSVEAALALADTIHAVNAPVVALVESRALEAAALVALACDRVYVHRNAILVLRPILAVSEESDVMAPPPESFQEAYAARIHSTLAAKLGMSREAYEERTRAGWWLNAEEAVKARVADYLVGTVSYRELPVETTEIKRVFDSTGQRPVPADLQDIDGED